jgi:hypothetical protein
MTRNIFLLATLLLPCASFASDAEPIGRLFTSPEERARLDQIRITGVVAIPHISTSQNAAGTAPPPAAAEAITIDGFVRRSDGKDTTWINQVPQNENESAQTLTVLQQPAAPPAISVQLQSGKMVGLKAGQTVDARTGAVRDVYQDGAAQKPRTP